MKRLNIIYILLLIIGCALFNPDSRYLDCINSEDISSGSKIIVNDSLLIIQYHKAFSIYESNEIIPLKQKSSYSFEYNVHDIYLHKKYLSVLCDNGIKVFTVNNSPILLCSLFYDAETGCISMTDSIIYISNYYGLRIYDYNNVAKKVLLIDSMEISDIFRMKIENNILYLIRRDTTDLYQIIDNGALEYLISYGSSNLKYSQDDTLYFLKGYDDIIIKLHYNGITFEKDTIIIENDFFSNIDIRAIYPHNNYYYILGSRYRMGSNVFLYSIKEKKFIAWSEDSLYENLWGNKNYIFGEKIRNISVFNKW